MKTIVLLLGVTCCLTAGNTSPAPTTSHTDEAAERHRQAEVDYQNAVRLRDGDGEAQDYAAAAVYYRRAAEAGHVAAQYDLGYLYEKGLGVKCDLKQAAQWYRRAAEQGDAEAENNLGALYATGRGVRRDDAEAVRWYRLAAAQGDPEATDNLGMMYLRGRAVQKDEKTAFELVGKAARKGYGVAENNLGLLYANGQGVARDYILAWAWLDLAAEQLPGSATIRDRVAKEMSEADIAEARNTRTRLHDEINPPKETRPEDNRKPATV